MAYALGGAAAMDPGRALTSLASREPQGRDSLCRASEQELRRCAQNRSDFPLWRG